jgi:ParB/RepB/Spo0J family partition protein
MAVTFKPEHSRSSEYRFYPELIKVDPDLNGRHDKPEIDWLIQDILLKGQLVPVTIRNDGGTPVLACGFSRWRAISEINSKKLAPVKLPLRCVYQQMTEAEAFAANISENRQRNQTTPLDDGFNIKRLMTVYAMTAEQVAQVYFPVGKDGDAEFKSHVRWVNKMARLADLSPAGQKALRDGRIKTPAALAIAKLSQAQQKEAVENAEKGIRSARKAAKNGGGGANSNSNGQGNLADLIWIKKTLRGVIEANEFLGLDGRTVKLTPDVSAFVERLLDSL